MLQKLPEIQPRKSKLRGLNLLQTAVPVYNKELLPKWTTKDPDSKGNGRNWSSLRTLKNVSEKLDNTPQTARVIPIQNQEVNFLSPIRQTKQVTLEAGVWKRLATPKTFSQIMKSRKSVKEIPVKLDKIPCISPRLEIYQKLNNVREDEKEEEKLLKHIENEMKERRHSRIDQHLEKIQSNYFSPINRRNRVFENSLHEKQRIETAKERSEIILEEKKKKYIESMNRWEIRRKLKEQKLRKLNNKRKIHTLFIVIQIINKLKYLKTIYIPYYNSLSKHSKLFYHVRQVIWEVLMPQIRRRRRLSTCIEDINIASTHLCEFLKQRKVYRKLFLSMKIYLHQCMKVKRILLYNNEIIKAKKQLLYLYWDKVENQVLKQYNAQKAQELKAVKERMLQNHINVSSNVKITRITKLPDKYKIKYCGMFLTDIRQQNYIETKTANRYTNYIATENDIKDIFLDPDETKVKEISKKLVAKPHLKYNHYLLIKKAKMRNGIRDFVMHALNEYLTEEDERKSEILSARNSLIKQNSSEKNISNNSYMRRTSRIVSEPRH